MNNPKSFKTILVVDDEQSMTLTLELLLSKDYRVLTASNGEEALFSVKDFKPDLILLDIMMPGLDGLETLKLLRSHPDFRKTPVILMSGARPLVKQSEYGWNEFLDKPFTAEVLMEMIKRYI